MDCLALARQVELAQCLGEPLVVPKDSPTCTAAASVRLGRRGERQAFGQDREGLSVRACHRSARRNLVESAREIGVRSQGRRHRPRGATGFERERRRFWVGKRRQGVARRHGQDDDRFVGLARDGEVTAQPRRDLSLAPRVLRLQPRRDRGMDSAFQAMVAGVRRVPARAWRNLHALTPASATISSTVDRLLERRRRVVVEERVERPAVETLADHRSGQDDVPAAPRQAVDPGEQTALQGRRNSDGHLPFERPAVPVRHQRAGRDEPADLLLEEEWVAAADVEQPFLQRLGEHGAPKQPAKVRPNGSARQGVEVHLTERHLHAGAERPAARRSTRLGVT